MQQRMGESGKAFARADRYYSVCGEWFFSTREKVSIGPFAKKEDAEAELMLFLRHIGEGGIYIDRYVLQQRRWNNNQSWL